MAQETIFGWVLTGPLSEINHKVFTTHVSCSTKVGRHKRYRKCRKNNIKIGAMVVFREENLPINKWQLGHVVKVYFGRNDYYKVVEIKTESAKFYLRISELRIARRRVWWM